MTEAIGRGQLVLVSTPIGNLGDIGPRALDVLGGADVVACEDTRHTGRLLAAVGVRVKRLLSVHEHNEASRVPELMSVLDGGGTVAVVSDAGTPTLSDPGSRLVTAAVEAGHAVRAVPGASALLAALVVSGLPADRFVFEGFLPRRGRERALRLAEIAAERRTTVIYESPRRVATLLEDLTRACGPDRPVSVSRELTKMHETTWRGTLGESAAAFEGGPRGEYVVVVAPARSPRPASDDEVAHAMARERAGGASRSEAARVVAEQTGRRRREVYDLGGD